MNALGDADDAFTPSCWKAGRPTAQSGIYFGMKRSSSRRSARKPVVQRGTDEANFLQITCLRMAVN
jgi:hypothetical protein